MLPSPAPGASIDWPAIEAWVGAILPIAELVATPQDPVFHAEGDVWTHTRLALEALVASEAYAAAAPAARGILAAGVLLHDLGKPSTTRHDGARVTSQGHSARGESLARVALWRQGVPFGVREHVCALIRHHHAPFFGIDRPAAEAVRSAVRLSLVTRHDWLCAVAEADARGRRCTQPGDREGLLERCALWAEHCRELGLLDRPQVFASPHTRRIWFEAAPGARAPDVPAHDDTSCEVLLLSGLPASGKDTWLRAEHPGLPVLALDDLRDELDVAPDETQAHVIAAARDRARGYLREGSGFAWNATNLTRPLRAQLLELFRGYRARTRVVYVETTAPEQLARNRARARTVPTAVIDRMLLRWSVPDPSEAHVVTYVVPPAPAEVAWPPTPQGEPAVKA